jgi:hypothetical protein
MSIHQGKGQTITHEEGTSLDGLYPVVVVVAAAADDDDDNDNDNDNGGGGGGGDGGY